MNTRREGWYAVLLREARSLLADMNIRTIVLIAPLVYPLLYGAVYWHKTEADVAIVVVDEDHSALSREFIRDLDALQLVQVTEVVPDLGTAQDRLYRLDAQGIVVLPGDFSRSQKMGKGADVKVLLNTSRFLSSNDLNKAITSVAVKNAASLRVRYLEMAGYNAAQAREISDPVRDDVRPTFNVSESYGEFLVPGIFLLILQQTLLIGLSQSVAKEREDGTLADLYHTAHRSVWTAVSGKAGLYFLLYVSYAVFYAAVYFTLFTLPMNGDLIALGVLTAVFLVSIIAVSILISTFFTRKIIALQTIAFTSYPIFFLSGYSWPKSAMPLPLQYAAEFLPSTQYFTAAVRIMEMHARWSDVLPETVRLIGLTLAALAIMYMRMRTLLRSAR